MMTGISNLLILGGVGLLALVRGNQKSEQLKEEVKETEVASTATSSSTGLIFECTGNPRLSYFNLRLRSKLLSEYGDDLANAEYAEDGTMNLPYRKARFRVKLFFKNGTTRIVEFSPEEIWGQKVDEEEKINTATPEEEAVVEWLSTYVGEIDTCIRQAANCGFTSIDYEVDEKSLKDTTLEAVVAGLQKNNDFLVVVNNNKIHIDFTSVVQEYLDMDEM